MKVLIDGIEKNGVLLQAADVPAYIARLKEELRKEDKAIERIECDGTIMSAHGDVLHKQDYSSKQSLNVVTKGADLIVQDMLKEVAELLPHLIKALQAICSALHKDKVPESLETYMKILPSLKIVLLGLLSAQQAKKVSADLNSEEINTAIQELNQALNNKDYTVFCDLLEYRLLVQLQQAQAALFQGARKVT